MELQTSETHVVRGPWSPRQLASPIHLLATKLHPSSASGPSFTSSQAELSPAQPS